MKTKIHILSIVFLFLFSVLSAQNIETYFETQQTVPFQKLYLHVDREFYFTGDTLWFAAYLLEGQTYITTLGSCNLYVDLINTDGKIIKNELFPIQDGLGSGYISLSDSAGLEGNFRLRAFTDYLKNFGNDAFFTKTIRVSAVKNSFELASEQHSEVELVTQSSPAQFTLKDSIHKLDLKPAGEKTEIDVQFFPEGGFLLAGESNCVAFKAIDKTGKGIEISGKLFDENGDWVLNFLSFYKGAGKFYFYPKSGKNYKAKIDGYPELYFPLPEIKETGAKLKLVNQDENKIQLVVQGKNNDRNQQFYLVCLHRGEGLFYKEIDRKKINSVLKIDAGQLRGGINRFVLLDNNLNPVSERLVFKENQNNENIEIRLNNESFSTRDEVQLHLKSDNFIENELARVSISVVDENYINAAGIPQNIASYLLLDSELKGHIDSPAGYLISDENLNAKTKLDLLMCTNGWRNYIWNSLKEDSVKIEFQPQLGLNFTGHVKRAFGNKALTEGNVSFLVKSDSTTQFLDIPLDEKGKFEFRNIVFYDSASVFAQARNKNNKNAIQFEMELPKIIPPEIKFNDLLQLQNFSSVPYSVYRQSYLNEMRLKEFYPDKNNILVGEVEVKAKLPRPEFKTGNPKKNDGPFKLTWEMTAGSFDIIEYLAYKVPGIWSQHTENGLMIKVQAGRDIGPPGFFIDGFQYFSINEIKYFGVHDFSTIEIITPPMSYAYGARAMYGAIILTLNRGDEIDPIMPLLGGIVERIKGFTTRGEFYSPKYTPSNINTNDPDYRNTLYWNPKIIIENGEKEVSFFTCDNLSRYKVFVEGITNDGKICLGSAEFEVLE